MSYTEWQAFQASTPPWPLPSEWLVANGAAIDNQEENMAGAVTLSDNMQASGDNETSRDRTKVCLLFSSESLFHAHFSQCAFRFALTIAPRAACSMYKWMLL